MVKESINEAEELIELEEDTQIQSVILVDKRFVQRFILDIEEALNANDLLDTCQKGFSTLATHANTITSRWMAKELQLLVQALLSKIKVINESVKSEGDGAAFDENELFDRVFGSLMASLDVLEGVSDQKSMRLTFSAAFGLTSLLKALLAQKTKPTFNPQNVGIILNIVFYLEANQKVLVHFSKDLYKLIKKFRGYNQDQLVSYLLSSSVDKKSKYSQLALLAKESGDAKLYAQIAESFNNTVLNDKDRLSHENFKHYIPFLVSIDEKIFTEHVLGQIEFMLKRNGSLIHVIAKTFEQLTSVNFSPELVKLLIEKVFTDDILSNQEFSKDIVELFRKVAGKLSYPETAKTFVIDFLLKKFQAQKAQAAFPTKQNIAKYLSVTVQSLKAGLLSQDHLATLLSVILEHVFTVKEEAAQKEIFSFVVELFKKSEGYQFLVEPLKKVISKTSNFYQIALFNELIHAKKNDLGEVISTLSPQVKQMLNAENYKITANYSTILTYSAFLGYAYQYTNDQVYLQALLQNSNLIQYLATTSGYANTLGYFQKDPSLLDAKYHLKNIEVLLVHHYLDSHLSTGDSHLRDILFEYLLNQQYKFREHQVFDTLEAICPKSELANFISTNLINSLYIKIKQVSLRPNQPTRDELPHQSSVSPVHQIKNVLKFILRNRTCGFSYEEFITLLKIISHPYISTNNKSLMLLVKALEESIGEERLRELIQIHAKNITKFAITQRTGILSTDVTLRKMAINLAVILASQKQLDLYLQDFVQILDYKPFEMITKLSGLLEQEFDRISHYDLMFYSEITKDLHKVFKEVDAPIVAKELETESASQEEEKKGEDAPEEVAAAIDPAKLQAQLLKQQAALKKQGAAAKKGAKPVAKAQPAKEAPKKAAPEKKAAAEKTAQEQPMDKEQRNKFDRQQLLNYFNEITAVKNTQIEAVYEILKRVNKNGFCLDNTLQFLLLPMVRLLNYQISRFSTTICLQSLFASHKTDHLFPVKNEVVSCLIAMSQGRIYQKHMREFQVIFQHVEQNTNLDFYDKGHIDLLLLMGNHVLKDMSVHLSVKEQALSVIQSFLSTDKVNDIELVRVTINMMKSSYNSKNLSSYLNELMKRLKKEHIALILQRLFEYEPIPRMAVMKEIIEYDEPLFCPVWLSTQIWILQFDEECSKLARRLWNKYGMALRTANLDISLEEQSKNMFFYLRSKNTAIYDATLRGAVAAIEIFQNRYDLIVDDLIEFYNKEMLFIDQEGIKKEQQKPEFQGGNQQNQYGHDLVGDERLNRMAVAEIIKRTAHLVPANSFKKIFDFFITKGCLDNNEEVQKICMEAALAVISAKGTDYAEEILKILEKYINEQKKYSELSKNQAIIMIGSLAQYLDNTSQKKLIGTFEKMLELLNTPSELIRQSICRVIPQLARFFDDKSKKFLEDNLKILRESQDEKALRGSAYAVAGIIKGLGLSTLTSMDILTIVHKECFSKQADPLRKVSGIYLYETLSISLGKVFEMNIEKILPNIMLCVSDPKDIVRRAAIQANKTIMGRLSNHAIKQVLPIFLHGLYVENWRSKLASVEALGNMAYCAPRQISTFLPQIVKGIREVLNDTHEKVHASALQAIQNIGGVIKCPEIADILETLVKALSNPTAHLKHALKLLLETSFVHAIDAPSLSLLVPILDSGLMMHDNESKQLASRLMGNICNLTQDPSDLLPYIKILMPAIRNSLFDSIPEIRGSAAKALGSLSSGLGLENSHEMVVWLDSVLHQRGLQVSERQGAAQGYAEMVSVHGVGHFEETIRMITIKSNDADPGVRESFRSVMIYLATSFDQFVHYLPQLLPIMIQGLSDDFEDVRKISMKNVKICIKQYGKQAPNQLVVPILQMMFHRDFRVRSSSSILMYQLVKELENDIIKSQPKYISVETKQDILSAMFILRYDIIERVSLQASQIWKNIIDNQLKIVKQILHVLIKQVFELIQSEYLELCETGLNCMRGIVEKFGEKVVTETIEILENFMERATQVSQTVGISKAVYNMVYAAPTKLLTDLRQRFLTMMDSNLHHENEEIRKLSGQVYLVVFQKTFEPNFMTSFLDKSFVKKLNHLLAVKEDKESELLIQTLKFMLAEAPDLKLEDKLIRLFHLDTHEVPLTIAQSKILAAVAPKIAVNMFKKKFYQNVLSALQKELTIDAIDDEARINEVLKTFSEVIAQASEDEIVTINEQIIADFHFRCKDKQRLGFYVDFIAYYCTNSKVNYEKYASQYLSNVLVLMNDKNDKLVDKVIKSFSSIINGLQKENQFTHIPLIKHVIEQIAVEPQVIRYGNGADRSIYKKKVPTIKMLEKVDGVKTLSSVIQNSITHGSLEIRIDSAICFQYLVDFSKLESIKTELIKICGALIRVVNDKFAPALKLEIFQALKLILIKTGVLVKAMAPQLQTTFLKAFSDSQATRVVRKVVVECLVLFLKIALKIDPIVKDLTSFVEGDKIDSLSKVEASEILAIIIRLNGKTIQQAMTAQIQASLQSIVQTRRSQFNERTLANCAAALGFLAAYQPDQKQTLQLFESLDSIYFPSVSLGLKYGILLNGVDLPEKKQLIEQTEKHTLDMLKDSSGIEEIDGHESEDAKENEEGGKLHGTFEVLSHIGDVFLRRFGTLPAHQELYTQHFRVVNTRGILRALNDQASSLTNHQTFGQVVQYLSEIPVKLTPGSQEFDSELKIVLTEGMDFIRAFYLDFESKRDAFPAIINIFILNYDNFLEVSDDKIQLLTQDRAREVIYRDTFKNIISENLRSLAVELLFI